MCDGRKAVASAFRSRSCGAAEIIAFAGARECSEGIPDTAASEVGGGGGRLEGGKGFDRLAWKAWKVGFAALSESGSCAVVGGRGGRL